MNEAVIGLIGVIVGAIITGTKELWMAWRSCQKDGKYLAIRVVSIFDRYVEGCTEVVSDDGLYQGQRDADGCRHLQASLPEFEIQSLDVDWKAIPANLMYEILSFPNLINTANHRIDGAFEYAAGPPDYEEGFEERQYQYAVLGLKAASLADQLRSNYGVPVRENSDWNPVEYLNKQKCKIFENQEKRSASNAQFMNLSR